MSANKMCMLTHHFLHRFTLTRTRSDPTHCFIVFVLTAEDFDVFERRNMEATGDKPSEEMEEEEQMPACTCKLFDSKPCHTRFDRNKLFMFRLTSIGLSWENLDANILGCIGAGFHQSDTTEGTKRKSTDRVASRTDYFHGGHRICREIFKYLYEIGQDKLNNLIKHYKQEGHRPRIHKKIKKRPIHSLSFETTYAAHDFILNYASLHVVHLPGRTPHHWRCDVKLDPTNCTKN